MIHLKNIFNSFLVSITLVCCSGQKAVSDVITVVEKKSSAPVYLTCYQDYKMLLFFIPMTIEISHNIKDTLKLDNIAISECNSQKMKVAYELSHGKFNEIDPDNPEYKIFNGKPQSVTFYRGFSLAEADSLYFKGFNKEVAFIKKNVSESNGYRNDTITYQSIDTFTKEHQNYYLNKVKSRCQKVKIYFHHYDKIKKVLSTPTETITAK